MTPNSTENVKILNTTKNDFDEILFLFEEAMKWQGKKGYKVWNAIDKNGLKNDITHNLQYKITKDKSILCIFSVQYNDPFIWRERDKNNAIYLHRIVVNPKSKGLKMFKKVLTWAKEHAAQKNLHYIRMDTWADNAQLIAYYKSFGFTIIDHHKTSNTTQLPIQNRNLDLALLEIDLMDNASSGNH